MNNHKLINPKEKARVKYEWRNIDDSDTCSCHIPSPCMSHVHDNYMSNVGPDPNTPKKQKYQSSWQMIVTGPFVPRQNLARTRQQSGLIHDRFQGPSQSPHTHIAFVSRHEFYPQNTLCSPTHCRHFCLHRLRVCRFQGLYHLHYHFWPVVARQCRLDQPRIVALVQFKLVCFAREHEFLRWVLVVIVGPFCQLWCCFLQLFHSADRLS